MTTAFLGRLREIRAAHATHRALARELSAYKTEGDLNDLGAILDRYDDTETAQIRGILAAQHADAAA